MTQALSPAPAAYRRRLFHARDAPPDNCTEVWWIQGDRYFCDARFTTGVSGRPEFHMGFAGELEPTGVAADEFEWVHAITAGASFGSADVGQLFEVPGWGLLEVGRGFDYVELWQRCSDEVEPMWETRGIDESGTEAVVVCVGDRFGLALGPDAAGNRPVSVHIGARHIGSLLDGSRDASSLDPTPHDAAAPAPPEWRAEHSSWALRDPLHFSIDPTPDGGFTLSWRAGDLSGSPMHFHPILQGARS
ncbi:hypothetical protein [Dietzia massiliensis]|uniref:hypothetical protein n=1 Tax=Dietzia massiliensis TaxID=2697499 RepID=UPI001BCAFAE8|nr:hypothetical protein [Dietzia massiliensis]MBS7549417.1 hypothetical protein [Dietzia massiliensis]